jgi:hypothetical protein
MRRTVALFLTISALASTPAAAEQPNPFISKYLQNRFHLPAAPSYKLAEVDLNGDGRPDSIVYLTDPNFCGSGGCNLYVLSPVSGSYRLLMRATIVQLPIRLLPSLSHGWRDIGVTVSGGGIVRPYEAALKFDGHRYPSNPSMPPAIPLHRPVGRVLIPR